MKRFIYLSFILILTLAGCKDNSLLQKVDQLFPTSASDQSEVQNFEFPEARGYVNDFADVMPVAWEGKTEQVCELLEKKTTAQMTVVSVQNLAPFETAQDYATALGNEWGVGQKDANNGIVIFAAIQDREMFLARGEGFSESLDAVLDSIYRNVMVPWFQKEEYGEGFYQGARATAIEVGRVYGIDLTSDLEVLE
jgi:uncharacterized protein